MTPKNSITPELMPVLGRGKHRTPRSGGCFMEFASYLAGEAWSDHPACTHPVLAALARMVNDCTSDAARGRLSPLIPSVIGLRGADARVGLLVAIRAGTAALPVANAERQRALAVGLLTCERQLQSTDSALQLKVTRLIRAAFAEAPDTRRWAGDFIASMGSWSRTTFTDRTAESIARVAVQGIAEACVPDAEERMRVLLADAIEDCAGLLGASHASATRGVAKPGAVESDAFQSVPA